MSNYRQSAVAGDSWVRAVRVVAENPSGGAQAISFIEERIINLPDQKISQPLGNVSEPFTAANALEPFNLLDPATGVVLGTAVYQDVYVMLHSLYRHIAAKRDVANPPTP